MIFSCSKNYLSSGRITFYNNQESKSFSFSVDDRFLSSNLNSPKDKDNPKMTEAEARLLTSLLAKKGACLDKSRKPNFTIISRQEKVYDMTFAHLIEKNYRAKPITPLTYFGKCRAK